MPAFPQKFLAQLFQQLFKIASMAKSTQPEFIREKILDCGQVIIYRCIDSNTRQVLGYKNTFDMDSCGQLFFNLDGRFAEKYPSDLFPVKFFFYRKGKPFYISAKGLAVKILRRVLPNEPAQKSIRAKINLIEFNELNQAKKNYSFLSYFSFLSFH